MFLPSFNPPLHTGFIQDSLYLIFSSLEVISAFQYFLGGNFFFLSIRIMYWVSFQGFLRFSVITWQGSQREIWKKCYLTNILYYTPRTFSLSRLTLVILQQFITIITFVFLPAYGFHQLSHNLSYKWWL